MRAQLTGEESEGLPDVMYPQLEDGTHGGGLSVREQGEWSGWMWVIQESSLGQARFELVEDCSKRVGPGKRMGALDFRDGEGVVKAGLDTGCVWKETTIEI